MIAGHTIDVIEHNLAIIEATNATKTLIAAVPTLESTESDDDGKLPPLTPYVDDDLPKIIAIYSNDKPNILYLSESDSDEDASALISNKEKQNLYCYKDLHNYYRTDLLAAWFKSTEWQDRLQELRVRHNIHGLEGNYKERCRIENIRLRYAEYAEKREFLKRAKNHPDKLWTEKQLDEILSRGDRVWSWYRIYEMEIRSRQNSKRELINIDISDAQHNKRLEKREEEISKRYAKFRKQQKKEKKIKFKKEFGRDFYSDFDDDTDDELPFCIWMRKIRAEEKRRQNLIDKKEIEEKMAVRLLSCYDDEPYFDGENCYHEIPDSKVGSLFRFNRRNVIYTAEPGDIDLEGEEYMKVLISRSDALVLKYNTLRKEEQLKKKLKRDNTSEKDDDDCDDREPTYTYIRKRMDAEKKCITVDEDEHLANCLTRRLKGIEAKTIRNSLRVNSSETINYIIKKRKSINLEN
jgi:hypothetical protein